MNRHAKIATACLAIIALTVDNVGACWLFARRACCRPCYSYCYSAPVVYDSCTMPATGMSTGGGETLPPQMTDSPSMRIPWQGPNRAGGQPTPADGRRPPSDADRLPPEPPPRTSPSDRNTFRQPPRETEPMPEPPQPAPGSLDNPFERSSRTETPAPEPSTTESPAPAPRESAPAERTEPMPGGTDLSNPFGTPPTARESAPPAPEPGAREAPADNPFAPRAPAGGSRSDNPLTPRSSAPPAGASDNPFGPPPDATKSSEATKSSDSQPPMENPIAPTERDAAPAPDNPFAPPSDSTKSPMSNVNDAPMNDTGAAIETLPAGQPQPASDNPFAEPANPRVSAAAPAYEPADSMRVWSDVTGKHQVRGQMKRILVAEQKVRILKDTGKYTTVPFARLSESDRTFVAHYSAESSALLAQGQ